MENTAEHVNNSTADEEKPRTLFIGNIPIDAAKYDIESIFGEIGPLKRIHFQYPRNSNKNPMDTIIGYVTYALSEDAATAASKKGGYSFHNNKLTVKLVNARSETQPTKIRLPKPPRFGYGIQQAEVPKPKPPRQKPIKKKARLIIRNLSFHVTENNLKEHFGAYGGIKDINILKKPSGKLVGCAFIQYEKVSQAAKALRDLNSKPFLDRPITIDWAVPKTKFEQDKDQAEVKEEVEVKEEKPDVDDLDVTIKEEPLSDDEKPVVDSNIRTESSTKPKRKRRQTKSDSESDSSDTDDDIKVLKKDSKSKSDEKTPRPLNPNDADEGKTLFIRNLNFDTTADTLKEFFQEFGPVNYAVICKDRLTEHSKGTAFIKFRSEETLTNCLQKYEEDPDHFVADDRQFYISQAMSRSRLSEKLTPAVQNEPKDKRNLYLVREGFVRPGTTAAEGMSPGDIALRANLHQHKRQMLKDLNNFISDKRLCIHNLPEKFGDKKLRSLVLKHGGPGAKVTEAKVMRDKTKISFDGFKSKGFGFVTFTEHQHALTALRALNNNPQIFSKHRRPVVEFSLEKKAALKAKEKRLEKSREKLKEIEEKKEGETKESKKKGRKRKAKETATDDADAKSKPEKSKSTTSKEATEPSEESVPEFGGLVSQVGLSTIPSLKPKGKAASKNILKASKPKIKKLLPRRKREKKSQPTRDKGADDHFEKRLSAYKEKNYGDDDDGPTNSKKKKWYA